MPRPRGPAPSIPSRGWRRQVLLAKRPALRRRRSPPKFEISWEPPLSASLRRPWEAPMFPDSVRPVQAEGLRQEDGHLAARQRLIRTEVSVAAARGDSRRRERL